MRNTLLKIRFLLIPSHSPQEGVYHLIRLALLVWKQHGFRALLRQAFRALVARRNRVRLIDSLGPISYEQWIAENEPDEAVLKRQRMKAGQFNRRPLISFISPVYNPGTDVLRDTLRSVLAQTYPHWEFCLANGSTNPEVARVLDEFARQDARIRPIQLGQNLGIAENTNAALRQAQGEYVALLDHDDLVAPDMLFEVVSVLNRDPQADIVYFDEDKISEDGRTRLAPWFKPQALSPDLLLSTNVWMHSVIRKSLIEALGGFDPQMDGAQDWDLSLRCMEKSARAVHIPRVFYHWRQVAGSAARDANAKPWAFAAQERCITAHLRRLGVRQPQVDFPSLGLVHIQWPTSGAKASIIIPTKNKPEVIKACLNSIFERTTYPNYEIVLIDNGSTDPEVLSYYRSLEKDPRVCLVSDPRPFNYHSINNLGAQNASGAVLVFLNNDTEVLEPNWLTELVGWAERDEVGVVGAKLLRPDGSIQHGGIVMGIQGHGSHIFEGCPEHTYGYFGSSEWYRDYNAVTGACMAVRREVFEQLGGFDEAYVVGYGDIDLCLRARALGYRVVYNPFVRLLHHEGATRGFSLPPGDVLRASLSMQALVRDGDPYFNPNLSYTSRIPAIANPHEEDRVYRLERIMRMFDLIEPQAGEVESLKMLAPDPRPVKLPAIQTRRANRLLFVSHELSLSGAPIMMWLLAERLSKRGYQIKVLSHIDGPLAAEYKRVGIEVIAVPNLLTDARVIVPYLDGFDLVCSNTVLAWRTIVAARAFGRATVWWLHESGFGLKYLEEHAAAAQTFAACDAAVFPCEALTRLYREYARKDNFHTIYNGLDVDGMDSAGVSLNPAKLNLVTIGSIEPRKGQDVLLQAMKELPVEVQNGVELYIIGRSLDPAFSKELVRQSRGMANIHWVGALPKAKVYGYMQQAGVVLTASRDEVLPLNILEAMALGKCLIGTDVGGIGEAIRHEESGLLVEAGNAHELAACIQRVYEDRQLLQRLSENAQERYQRVFSPERFEVQFLKLFDGILSAHYDSPVQEPDTGSQTQ